MITPRIKEFASTREKLAQPERTPANELPQELAKLSVQCGFSEVNSFLKEATTPAHGDNRKKAGHPKKTRATPRTRNRMIDTTTGFTDDGHPTVMASTCDLNHRD